MVCMLYLVCSVALQVSWYCTNLPTALPAGTFAALCDGLTKKKKSLAHLAKLSTSLLFLLPALGLL